MTNGLALQWSPDQSSTRRPEASVTSWQATSESLSQETHCL
ncbi:unnamed protein product [Tetraodon nigroviridis]|uniref:(spotted green pufferfish) hypothetical protein n=1 Tax=Tetraodon nigroviridis TaxID=99883 RepID=Q4SLX3_TETNG|nr:unnamed protein product [Tetraodon nigroviridis]